MANEANSYPTQVSANGGLGDQVVQNQQENDGTGVLSDDFRMAIEEAVNEEAEDDSASGQ